MATKLSKSVKDITLLKNTIKELEEKLAASLQDNIQIKLQQNNDYITNLFAKLKTWITTNNICNSDTNKQKIIVQDLFWLCKDNNININDISIIQNKLHHNDFIMSKGNIWNYLTEYFGNQNYVNFFKHISDLTSVGYNKTPNSCSGKYELLWRLLRPNSNRPAHGDIIDDSVIIEIKGKTDKECGVRFSSSNLNGKQYKINCDIVFENTDINPNIIISGGLKGANAFEIEKRAYKRHYTTEFLKDIIKSKKLLTHYFKINKWKYHIYELDNMFVNDTWDQSILHKIILRNLFIDYKEKEKFNKLYIFGDGTNIKILETIADFDNIIMKEDYFRINQTAPVGWYIE